MGAHRPRWHNNGVSWSAERLRIRPLRLVVGWLIGAASLAVAAAVVPGVSVGGFAGALLAMLLIPILNALIPPLVAALRVPFTALLDFVLLLVVDAALLLLVSRVAPGALTVDDFGWALVASLVSAAAGVVLAVVLGANDDDTYTLRVVRRIARRTGGQIHTDVPGIVFLEIDGLALPVLKRAMRDGSAPVLAQWVASGTHRLGE